MENLSDFPLYCRLLTDSGEDHGDHRLISITIYLDDIGFVPSEHAQGSNVQISDPEEINISGPAIVGEEGVAASVKCYEESPYSDALDRPINDLILFINVDEQAQRSSDVDRREAIETFARSYVSGMKDQLQCDV